MEKKKHRETEKLVAMVACVFTLVMALFVPGAMGSGCTTSQTATAEKTAVTALALTIPAIESARRAAYEQGLKAEPDVKKLPALAQAEALRASAMKALVRQLRLSDKTLALDSGAGSDAARKQLLWALADAMDDLLEAFSQGPLPKVPVPPAVLLGLKTLRGLAGPAPGAGAGAGDAAATPAAASKDAGSKSDG